MRKYCAKQYPILFPVIRRSLKYTIKVIRYYNKTNIQHLREIVLHIYFQMMNMLRLFK